MISPDDQPIPPRFWWLKRITIGSILLIVALAGLRWWWGYEAHRRLQAEIDRIIAAGEPIYPEDFDSKNTVPDDQNAVTALDDAVAALATLSDEEEKAFARTFDGKRWISRLNEVAPAIDNNRMTFEKLLKTLTRKDADWKMSSRGRTVGWAFPGLSGYREVCKLARTYALYSHYRSDDFTAIQSLRSAHRVADLLYRYPTAITQLVGWANDGLVCDAIQEISFLILYVAPVANVLRTLALQSCCS